MLSTCVQYIHLLLRSPNKRNSITTNLWIWKLKRRQANLPARHHSVGMEHGIGTLTHFLLKTSKFVGS